ncbi:MAG: immunoglobulin domain-containing protein [Bdellovibrionales bacterium]|nr:immunoglobulin domain-containing protein [Bdellovibrionales bacterium]
MSRFCASDSRALRFEIEIPDEILRKYVGKRIVVQSVLTDVRGDNYCGSPLTGSADYVIPPYVTSVPQFDLQPEGDVVIHDGTIVLAARAFGNPAVSYQWQKDGVNIPGATLRSYYKFNSRVGDSGSYRVIATNDMGSVASQAVAVIVSAPLTAPTIQVQPVGGKVKVGSAGALVVEVRGNPTPRLQWFKDGVEVPGATSNQISKDSIQLSDAGEYYVVATNIMGSVTSVKVEVLVNDGSGSPAIRFGNSEISAARGVALSAVTPTNGGGAITSCQATPALPAGLSLNQTTCSISGTPTVGQDVQSYSIVGRNTSGASAAVSVKIEVPFCTVSVANSGSITASTDLLLNVASRGVSKISYSCNGGADADLTGSGGAPLLNTGGSPFNIGKLGAGSYSCVTKGLPTLSATAISCAAPNPVIINVEP